MSMLHPLLHLLTKRPHLVADHLEAYADLMSSELTSVSASLKRRAVLSAAALCGFGVGVMLAGVALMLWAVMPVLPAASLWALVLVPVVPLAAAAACLAAAQPQSPVPAFDELKQQLRADMVMLRSSGAA